MRLFAAGLVVMALVAGVRLSRADRPVVLGLGTLAATLAASTAATGWPARARGPAATLLAAAAAYVLAARAARADGGEAVLTVLCAVAAVTAATGVVGVAWHHRPWALPVAGTWRLASTLTYSNAAGMLFALSLVPACVLVARAPGILRRVMLFSILVGLAGTLSRGGMLAAAAALVLMLIMRAVPLAPPVRPFVGAFLAAGGLLPAILGMRFGTAVAVAGIVVGLGVALLDSLPVSARAARAVTVAAVALVVAAAVAAPFTTIGPTRLAPSSNDRNRLWTETINQMDGHVLFGTGPGTYRLVAPKDDKLVVAKHAHNEYLQALSETGVVGLAGVLVALGAIGLAVWRARPSTTESRAIWTACTAGGVAFLVHSGLDFIWRIPLLVTVAFALAAVAIRSGEQPQEERT